MTELTTLAYLAGIIDADGFVTIHRSVRASRVYHAPCIGIAGTDRQPHDLAAGLWGGTVRRYQPKVLRYRAQFHWQRQGTSAVAAIMAVRPYLRIKAEQADLALELWESIEDGRSDDPFPWAPAGWDPVPARDALRADVRALQTRGRELDGRTWDEYPGGAE